MTTTTVDCGLHSGDATWIWRDWLFGDETGRGGGWGGGGANSGSKRHWDIPGRDGKGADVQVTRGVSKRGLGGGTEFGTNGQGKWGGGGRLGVAKVG